MGLCARSTCVLKSVHFGDSVEDLGGLRITSPQESMPVAGYSYLGDLSIQISSR